MYEIFNQNNMEEKMATYIVKIQKGGMTATRQEIEVNAASQQAAKKIGENMCKTTYKGYKVQGPPQLKK